MTPDRFISLVCLWLIVSSGLPTPTPARPLPIPPSATPVAQRQLVRSSSPPKARRFTQGEVLYLRHCADCHGWEGYGDGPLSLILATKPTNLRQQHALFVQRSDAELTTRILYGQLLPLPQTPNPRLYTEEEVSSLLIYIQTLPTRTWGEINRGKDVYDSLCAACHGLYGRGDGLGARSLSVPPPDLSTAEAQQVSDGELVRLITDGKGAMPGAGDVLTAHEIRALIPFLRTLSPGYERYNRFCAYCHGPEGRPLTLSETSPGATRQNSSLPIFSATYFQTHTPEYIRDKIQHMRKQPRPAMPHLASQLSADEVSDILTYLRALPPTS